MAQTCSQQVSSSQLPGPVSKQLPVETPPQPRQRLSAPFTQTESQNVSQQKASLAQTISQQSASSQPASPVSKQLPAAVAPHSVQTWAAEFAQMVSHSVEQQKGSAAQMASQQS
jgi:hypothetical protein